jgi:hypothetical protein
MNDIKVGEVRYFIWGDEGLARIGNLEMPLVTLWTVNRDESVKTIGVCPKNTAQRAGWVEECPFS